MNIFVTSMVMNNVVVTILLECYLKTYKEVNDEANAPGLGRTKSTSLDVSKHNLDPEDTKISEAFSEAIARIILSEDGLRMSVKVKEEVVQKLTDEMPKRSENVESELLKLLGVAGAKDASKKYARPERTGTNKSVLLSLLTPSRKNVLDGD